MTIILAGCTGTRLKGDIPKQYIEVNGKPMISNCLKKPGNHSLINSIVIMVKSWEDYINEWIIRDNVSNFSGYVL